MSRGAEITLFLGEGDFVFALRIGELRQLEENRGRSLSALGYSPGEASLEKVAARLVGGGWLVDEIREVLRLGLVGGGMDRQRAFDLVDRHVVPPDLIKCAAAAYAVVATALIGSPDDQPGGDTPGERPGRKRKTAPRASPTAGSAGVTSSGKGPSSASRPSKPKP